MVKEALHDEAVARRWLISLGWTALTWWARTVVGMATTYDLATFRIYRSVLGVPAARRKARIAAWPSDKAVGIITRLARQKSPATVLEMQKASGVSVAQVLRVTTALRDQS
jgi:hypothetical protein